jgi:hypothetical protein
VIYQHGGKWRIYNEAGQDAGMSFDTQEDAQRGLLAYGHYLFSGEITEDLGIYDPLEETE